MNRREYDIQITVNGKGLKKAIIDPHYEEKHAGSVDDAIILKLVALLDGRSFEADDEDETYEYYVTDGMMLDGKFYKLVWLLEGDALYIGIVNAYRRR